jgi:hypothetical protein
MTSANTSQGTNKTKMLTQTLSLLENQKIRNLKFKAYLLSTLLTSFLPDS